MRVLIVHDFGTPHGGAELMMLSLREGLRRRGHDARFFASTARPLPLDNLADYTCHGTMAAPRRILQVANPWAALELGRVLREFRPEVVHVRMFLTQLSPLILPQLRAWPSLLHIASYDLICPLTTKILPDGSACHQRAGMICYRTRCLPLIGVARAVIQTALRRRWQDVFDIVVANSHWTRRRVEAEGIAVDETVWNGVRICPPRPPLTSVPTVAFAGRLVPEKGVDVLLSAMANVATAAPDARLLIAGDGPQRVQLERLSASLGLASRVEFLGHRPRAELDTLLAGAWVQAVPSQWEEPFGLVAAEAMMRGTAVVASRAGGLAEQVVDGTTGFTVQPGDAGALAEGLLNVLLNRDRAETMGREGRLRALAEFSEDRMVERFEQLYERLAYSQSPNPHSPGVHRSVADSARSPSILDASPHLG